MTGEMDDDDSLVGRVGGVKPDDDTSSLSGMVDDDGELLLMMKESKVSGGLTNNVKDERQP